MKKAVAILFCWIWIVSGFAQFSPGDLSEAHKELEGIKNCTQCHSIGAKIDENKCLNCHDKLKARIALKKGFHVSKQVKGKSCISCHSEHHGRKFDAIHLDEKKFNHNLTGYKLEGGHQKVDCRDCHKPEYVQDAKLKKNKKTFLGLQQKCLSCHEDYHQGTLKETCLDCHSMKTFETAPKFDHNKSKFPLKGAHQKVSCVDCHKVTERSGKKFQEFVGMPFSKCTDCHKDPHENKFGQNCTECHNEFSWLKLKPSMVFDHNKTGYPLEGLHKKVDCKECHKEGYAKNLKYALCTDCHEDYHEKEFLDADKKVTDCKKCHDVQHEFTWSSYGLEEHQKSVYPLTGAHEAVSCIECHKPDVSKKWTFKLEEQTCISCHDNIHDTYLDSSFIPDNKCESCHNTQTWTDVEFDHNRTEFKLEFEHEKTSCRECHFTDVKDAKGNLIQEFKNKDMNCVNCHEDIHKGQFVDKGSNDCARCHTSEKNWPVPHFDHQKSEFPLEGKHLETQCVECHKPINNYLPQRVILYKIKPFECRDCHSS